MRRHYYDAMAVQITVRNVPAEVRDQLSSRAARKGQSMQEYLRQELERMASRPTVEEVSERIRERKARSGTRLSAADVLSARDADRR